MTDFVEMFRHWNAGRSQVQIYEALNIDRKTIRKYLAPALAEGLQPSPDEVFDEELWRARIRRWFPELVDPAARALTWPQIAAHHAVDRRSAGGAGDGGHDRAAAARRPRRRGVGVDGTALYCNDFHRAAPRRAG